MLAFGKPAGPARPSGPVRAGGPGSRPRSQPRLRKHCKGRHALGSGSGRHPSDPSKALELWCAAPCNSSKSWAPRIQLASRSRTRSAANAVLSFNNAARPCTATLPSHCIMIGHGPAALGCAVRIRPSGLASASSEPLSPRTSSRTKSISPVAPAANHRGSQSTTAPARVQSEKLVETASTGIFAALSSGGVWPVHRMHRVWRGSPEPATCGSYGRCCSV